MSEGFDHIDARVVDVRAIEKFYDALLPALGFTQKKYAWVDGDEWTFSTEPDRYNAFEYHAMVAGEPSRFLGVIEDPGHRPTLTRIAFRVASAADVMVWIERLPAIGAQCVEPSADFDAYPAVFFEDALGTKLEICARHAPVAGSTTL